MALITFKRKLDVKKKHTIPVAQLTWDVMEAQEIAVECLQGLSKCKMYYDVDLKLKPGKNEQKEVAMEKEEFDRLKDQLFEYLEMNHTKHNFVYTKYASRDWRSPTDGKISTHIVFQSKLMYRGYKPERSYLYQHFQSTVLDGLTDNVDVWLNAIDLSPYSSSVESDNVFRAVGKGDRSGKKSHHLPMNPTDPVKWYLLTPTDQPSITDTTLTLYSEINVQSVKEEVVQSSLEEAKPKQRGRPKKSKLESIPNEILIKMIKALDAEKRAYEHDDWKKLLLLTKTLLGDSGVDIFVEVSEASGYEDYDEKTCAYQYEKALPSGELTEGTLIYWLKEDNPEALSLLLKEAGHAGRENTDLCYYETYSASFMKDLVWLLNKDTLSLIRDPSGQIWIKQVLDPVYTNRWKRITKQELSYHLLPRLIQLNIAKLERLSDTETQLIYVNKDLNFLKRNVFEYLSDFIIERSDFDQFFETSVKKLCFSNGVVDLPSKQFSPWSANLNVHTKIVLPYKYTYVASEHVPQIKMIKTFLEEVLGEQWELFPRRIARMLGAVYDKIWHLFRSARDSGKSVIMGILAEIFVGYVQSFSSGMILTQRLSIKGDPTRDMSHWVALAESGCRIAFCQETPSENENDDRDAPVEYFNSKVLKTLTGGDAISGRRMFCDDIRTIVPQFSLIILGNANTRTQDPDIYQSCCFTKFPKRFLKQDDYNRYKENGVLIPAFHALADPMKKTQLKKYTLAWVHLMIEYYNDEMYPIDRVGSDGDLRDEDSKESQSKDEEFLTLFVSHFVKDNESFITKFHINEFRTRHSTTFKRSDVIPKIEQLVGKSTNHIKGKDGKEIRGYKGLRYIPCKECESENYPE